MFISTSESQNNILPKASQVNLRSLNYFSNCKTGRLFVWFLLGFFVFTFGVQSILADSLDTWTWRNPLPQGNTLVGVTYGGGQFVAVGGGGSIVTSPNGQAWTLRTSGTTAILSAVAYGGGKYVAVGYNGPDEIAGTIFTSPDGITWTDRSFGGLNSLFGITFAGGRFVAVGGSNYPPYAGTILTSPDGINWTNRNSGTQLGLRGVAYGNGRFIAVGSSIATSTGVVTSSVDGITWSATPLTQNLDAITYGAGLFVAVGGKLSGSTQILTSPDGVIWSISPASAARGLTGVAYGNGKFVAVSDTNSNSGLMLTSPDGFTWTEANYGGTRNNPFSVAFGNGIFTAVGTEGSIFSSKNAVDWTTRSVGSNNPSTITSVAFGANLFVASYYSYGIITSPDGITWSIANPVGPQYVLGLCYYNSRFVAVGYYGTLSTSSDGTTWTNRSSATSSELTSVAGGNNMLVAVGQGGAIVTSTDGITWTTLNLGINSYLSSVIFANNQFMIVGSNGTILTSSNGISWTIGNSGTTATLYAVTHGGGLWVAVGGSGFDPGVIFTSPDGVTWTDHSPSVSGILSAVAYGDNQFVAVGNSPFDSAGYTGNSSILTSTDGVTWTSRASGTGHAEEDSDSPQFRAITFANHEFVATGSPSMIRTSGVFVPSPTYTVTPVTGVYGSISPNTPLKVSKGGGAVFTATPNSKKMVNHWFVDGILVQTGGSSYSLINVTSKHNVRVTFKVLITVPDISVQQPLGSDLTDGTAKKSFGSKVVGSTSAAKTFTIKNTGAANLTGLNITKSGANSGDFIVTAPTKTSLAPDETTTFTVKFKPSATGTRTAVIHIGSNDPDENPFDIDLAGMGT